MKYVTKPVQIEAVRMGLEAFEETPEWLSQLLKSGYVSYTNCIGTNFMRNGFIIQRQDGIVRGKIGDYIVNDPFRGFLCCSGNYFDMYYEQNKEED